MNQMDLSPIETQWQGRLKALLSSIPIAEDVKIHDTPSRHADMWDAEVTFCIADEPYRLLVECLPSGQPRFVRNAVPKLGQQVFREHGLTRGLVVAPFLSPAARAILAETNTGWLDLAGNAKITFPRFHVEVEKADRDPFATKRAQRSLFYPKSARVLKVLLHRPHQPWMGKELSRLAEVSAGQVSNVRRALVEREWAMEDVGEGMRLTQPEALLDAWRDEGDHKPEVLLRGHTLVRGQPLEDALTNTFKLAGERDAHLLLASHSVARRMAPFARVTGEFFYADDKGLQLLMDQLEIAPTGKGENITVYKTSDAGLWNDAIPLGEYVKATDTFQTYLDLLASGERGREAAEHWRSGKIAPIFESHP